VKARRPWYEPSEKLPTQPVVNAPRDQFDTLVVDVPSALDPTDKKSLSVVDNRDWVRLCDLILRRSDCLCRAEAIASNE
jgi:hypothetical protein